MKIITIKLATFDNDADDISNRLVSQACTMYDAYLIRQSVLSPTKSEQKLMMDDHPELLMEDTNTHKSIIKCYETEHMILTAGEPLADDESHNCDMGCSTFEHILYESDKDALNYWRQHITPPRIKKRNRHPQKRKQTIL